jgi:hypothetical protein
VPGCNHEGRRGGGGGAQGGRLAAHVIHMRRLCPARKVRSLCRLTRPILLTSPPRPPHPSLRSVHRTVGHLPHRQPRAGVGLPAPGDRAAAPRPGPGEEEGAAGHAALHTGGPRGGPRPGTPPHRQDWVQGAGRAAEGPGCRGRNLRCVHRKTERQHGAGQASGGPVLGLAPLSLLSVDWDARLCPAACVRRSRL